VTTSPVKLHSNGTLWTTDIKQYGKPSYFHLFSRLKEDVPIAHPKADSPPDYLHEIAGCDWLGLCPTYPNLWQDSDCA
jgi:hypothetical protein